MTEPTEEQNKEYRGILDKIEMLVDKQRKEATTPEHIEILDDIKTVLSRRGLRK